MVGTGLVVSETGFPSLAAPGRRSGGRRGSAWRRQRSCAIRCCAGEGVEDGRGQPVLLIPGFLAGDGSLALMANWLRRTGHRPSRAGMLRQRRLLRAPPSTRLEKRLEKLVREQGQPRRDRRARAAAAASPRCSRRAGPTWWPASSTLGSPQVDPLAVHPLVRAQVRGRGRLGSLGAPGLFKRSCIDGDCCADFWERPGRVAPRGVGFVSVYSKSDGVVDWHACLDPARRRASWRCAPATAAWPCTRASGAPWPRRCPSSAAATARSAQVARAPRRRPRSARRSRSLGHQHRRAPDLARSAAAASASFASSSGCASTSVRTGTRGASARNSSPSARVRLATERSTRSPQRSS